ncbi:MAG: winged helix DNA-binding protein [Microbacterium sp.]|uniref:MarR family winged helix-turn-helix transcriptional regulator n=1 Tax=Microbacterium sp. TaxID=51671 RepID=UPI001DB0A5EA|nr:MarR family transcriptional regulator [Microbacterium sp.]MBW8762637.1 winged helix DNA-binding protein [Microbacterium sp.]
MTPILVALQLFRAHTAATRRLNDALQEMGMDTRHLTVMFQIRDGAQTHGELVRILGADKSGMVRTIDHLERLGFVTRTRSPQDRRVWHLALTESGSVALPTAQRHTSAIAAELFANLDSGELISLHAALSPITRDEQTAAAAPHESS